VRNGGSKLLTILSKKLRKFRIGRGLKTKYARSMMTSTGFFVNFTIGRSGSRSWEATIIVP
jgi:hypothetical protein